MNWLKSIRNRTFLVLIGLLVSSCSGPAAPPAPAGPAKCRVVGRVQPGAGISLGSGVVALLSPVTGSIQSVIRENAALTTATSTPSNAWPYLPFQKAIDEYQKARIASAVMTGPDGKFEFPDEVLAGDYVVTIGIPIVHDPGVGKPVPRDWPENLLANMQVKVLNREVTLPARVAWVLRISVNESRSDVVLGPSERITWPKLRPSDDQIAKIRNRSQQMDPIRRKHDGAEKQFRDADAKARLTGQPLDVKKAREKEAGFKREQESLQLANAELDQYLEQMLGQ
jgi:hypothetical protein